MKARRQQTVKEQAIKDELKRQATVERQERDHGEFVRMVQKIRRGVESKGELTYDVQDFMVMKDRLGTPFRTVIDGYLVAVWDATFCLMMIKEEFLGEKRKSNATDATTNKRQRTVGCDPIEDPITALTGGYDC
jgi:hypothetical protein